MVWVFIKNEQSLPVLILEKKKIVLFLVFVVINNIYHILLFLAMKLDKNAGNFLFKIEET